MASAGHNLNPFPCFPPPSTSSYNLPLSLPTLLNCDPSSNDTTTFNFHQPHQDPVSFLAPFFPIGNFSASTPPEAVINFAVTGNNIQAFGNIPSAPGVGKGTGKKDRHSKIYTAQGLRDRRVRLSIDIARKLFDLQDMLGYDKASKTLEWLFCKSKKAIKELSRSNYGNFGVDGGAKKLSLASDVEEEEEKEEKIEKEGWGLKMKSILSIDEEITKEQEEKESQKVETFNLLAKESRAKARARARERTMERKKVGENGNNDDNDGEKLCWEDDAEISQWKLFDQMKAVSKEHLREPSMVKRKWRPSIISGSSRRNLLISIDGIPINLTQNWDSNTNPNYPFQSKN